MDLDRALEIANDPAMHAYCTEVHDRIFVTYGEYELGIDEKYDEVVYALAYVSVELAMDGECFESVPEEYRSGDDAAAS
jgi:hypothetical protein